MNNENELYELRELEEAAKERYIENSDWEAVLSMLYEEELEKHKYLYNKIYGE